MRRELIDRLRCPYTDSRFEVSLILSEQASGIDFGVLSSEAGEFPIISGVLRLRADELQAPLVALLKERRHEEALQAALEVPFLGGRGATIDSLWRRAARGLKLGLRSHAVGPGKQRLYRLVTRRDATFVEAVAESGAENWATWQVSRFSMPTFLAVHALAHLSLGSRTILDFGCGLGHSAFLMKHWAPDAEIVCVDYSFTSLYLGKRFLVPDAQCLCLDGEYPLPFAEGHFDCVFSTDALQYIRPKIGLAREFRRVLSPDGTIAFAHLHNRLSPDDGLSGQTLTPSGYHGLFEGMVRRVYPEETIVADYVSDGALNLDRACGVAELNQARTGVSLVAANTESVFRAHTGILDAWMDRMHNPRINPVYRARQSGDDWVLERRTGPPYAVPRTIQNREILPQAWHVEEAGVDRSGILALRDTDRTQLRELVRRFLVLELPPSYVSPPVASAAVRS